MNNKDQRILELFRTLNDAQKEAFIEFVKLLILSIAFAAQCAICKYAYMGAAL